MQRKLRRHSGTAIALAVAIGLSGCFGSGAPEAAAPAAAPQGPWDTVVEGRVLDAELQPVRGATVEVQLLGNSTKTDLDGLFSFHGLEPGEYGLVAQKSGYKAQAEFIVVRVGEPARIEFTLDDIASGRPYHQTATSAGAIGCEVAVGTNPYDTTWTDCRQAEAVEHVPQYHQLFGAGVDRILIEVEWDAASQAASRLTLLVNSTNADGQPLTLAAEQGASPLRIEILEPVLDRFLPEGGVLTTTVRAAPMLDGEGAEPPSAGVAAAQQFNVHVTVFYFDPGGPGFTAVES